MIGEKTIETIIKWHETAKELPEQKIIKMKNKKGEYLLKIDEPCLVVWEDKIKPSRYLTEEKRWEGIRKNKSLLIG